MQLQSSSDDQTGVFLDTCLKSFQLPIQKSHVNQTQRFIVGERYGSCPEMPLISWIHEEGTGKRIHGC